MTTVTEATAVPTRSQRLRAATHPAHEALDQHIMGADVFANREQFARFLRVQFRFHCDLDGLYRHPALRELIPNLEERRRLDKIGKDLADLGHAAPATESLGLGAHTPLADALGWLYVAEGSNLGGTVLYKIAGERLGLHRELGARHLAAHPDGAARHWRAFTTVLDGITFDAEQEAQTIAAAETAFQRVRNYVEAEFGPTRVDEQERVDAG